MRYMTAGESHGKGLTAILDGFPAGVRIDAEAVDRELQRRQGGYGRGGRMRIESDHAEFLSGMFGSVTIGSPIAFFIANRDFEKWSAYTDPITGNVDGKKLTAVRPGHADHVGCKKYGTTNARCILERASARETAARVGIGALCKQLLAALGISIGSHVVKIGGIEAAPATIGARELNERADRSPVRCLDAAAEKAMVAKIDECKDRGDTVGGTVEIRVDGYPAGIGSHTQYDRKLDGILARHLMSIQAIKSVSFGIGSAVADLFGSQVHDEMYPASDGGVMRKTNRAGGIEGGMSNGETMIMRVAMKPIPTLMCGLDTVDTESGTAVKAAPERSDYCAVPAAGVVAESVAAFALADELLQVTGGDDLATIAARMREWRERMR